MLGLGVASNSGLSSDSASMSRQAAFANTKSLDFDGSDDYVNTNYTSNDLFRGNFSFSYWLNLDSANSVPIGVQHADSWQDSDSFFIQHFNGNINLFHYSNADPCIIVGAGTPVSLDTWYHIAVVVTKNSGSDTTYAVKVDNEAVSTSPLYGLALSEANHNAFEADGNFLAIGACNDNGTPDSFVNGTMDDVAIFTKALSSSEITAIYNDGVPKDESGHDNLLLYYRFEDDVTDTAGTSNATNNGATFSSSVPS